MNIPTIEYIGSSALPNTDSDLSIKYGISYCFSLIGMINKMHIISKNARTIISLLHALRYPVVV